jgi:ABC-2 type transport system permease protein
MSSAGAGSRPGTAELRDITGPSSLGGGARRFFDLLWLNSVTEFKLGYHGTALGFAWSFVRPVLLFGVLLLVFTQVFRFGDDVKNYPAMLLFNIMLFTFFSDATGNAVTSVVRSENVVRKMQFPRLVIPLSVVITNALQLALSLIVVFIFLLVYGVEPVWTWVLTPLLVGALVVITTAVAMLLSVLFVRIRDVSIIWTVLSTLLFYATPVLYPINLPGSALSVPESPLREIVLCNPLSPIFMQAREWVIDPTAPGAVEAADGNPLLVIIPVALFVAICVCGVWAFSRGAPRVAEEI